MIQKFSLKVLESSWQEQTKSQSDHQDHRSVAGFEFDNLCADLDDTCKHNAAVRTILMAGVFAGQCGIIPLECDRNGDLRCFT